MKATHTQQMQQMQQISDEITSEIISRRGSTRGWCDPAAEEFCSKVAEARFASGFWRGHEHNWAVVGDIVVDPTACQFGNAAGVQLEDHNYEEVPPEWVSLVTGRTVNWMRPLYKAGVPAYREIGKDTFEVRKDSKARAYLYQGWRVRVPADPSRSVVRSMVVWVHDNGVVSGFINRTSRYANADGVDVLKPRQHEFLIPQNGVFLEKEEGSYTYGGFTSRKKEAVRKARNLLG